MCTYVVNCICYMTTMLIGISGFIPPVKKGIHLEKLSTVYLPYRYENNTGQFRYPSGAAEQTAYDPVDQFVYVVGGNVLHLLDIKDISNPAVIHWQQFDNVDLTDVEYCGDYLFVAVDNNGDKENGYVNVYKKYNTALKTLELVQSITVGSLPDMIYPTSDCQTVVVAIEAEGYNNGSHFVDPEGAVGIIKFAAGVEGDYQYTKLDFRKFNDQWQNLVSRGARFIYRENNNTFSNDVEPEYITFNKDESVAYISLQENNAIAEVDMITQNITNIHPLGFKNWTYFEFDASDRDETSSTVAHWSSLNGYDGTLNALEHLGRLKISNLDGKSGDTYNTLYTFGGRSISILDLNTFERVYDSGSDIEKIIAKEKKPLFNANGVDRNDIVSETQDSLSDDKGPEVEDLAIAEIGDTMLLFVGIERPGFIAIYSIHGDVTSIQFESLYSGIPGTNDTYGYLYDQRKMSEKDPDDIRFISAQDSPNHRHLLCSTGSLSGTVSFFLIKGLNEDEVDNSGNCVIDHVRIFSIGLIVLLGKVMESLLGRL
ncbi:uncharacterized protein LOC117333300 isoform X3 [Pecten maximus]|uniref:uncharacterized protein LOC117333300 isoform X3 n=1 Tax=Pecten maximus TaxID=6579 RepID=UPI001458772A|nr:uncharacterized protein LOC117333300 isoform X3 [Pecten maximus]